MAWKLTPLSLDLAWLDQVRVKPHRHPGQQIRSTRTTSEHLNNRNTTVTAGMPHALFAMQHSCNTRQPLQIGSFIAQQSHNAYCLC
jgi:hypothetical protein